MYQINCIKKEIQNVVLREKECLILCVKNISFFHHDV